MDAGSPLYAPARAAADAWQAAVGRPISITEDGDIPIFQGEIPTSCDPDRKARGCSYVTNRKSEGYIVIAPSVLPTDLYGVLLHEIGHHLRGVLMPDHASDPNAVMYFKRTTTALTPSDIAFVCESFDCAPP